MKKDDFIQLATAALLNQRCWYVSTFQTTFQLAFGSKIQRSKPLRNKFHSRTYRKFEGSANLLVWCTWRLERGRKILTSSDDETARGVRELELLKGKTIQAILVTHPAWDLSLTFDDKSVLRVFCDFVNGRSLENWSLHQPTQILFAGPSAKFGIENRTTKIVDLTSVKQQASGCIN